MNPIWFESLSCVQHPELRLFCFPYAGGSAEVFRPWRRYFSPAVDLRLVHLPGRGHRFTEQPFRRLNPLVQAIADHIGDELQRPFAFYGHSMGALISFELARELRRRHAIEPVELFLSGRGAPHLSIESTSFNLPHEKFISKLRELNGTPREVLENEEITNLFLPILRADFELVDTYEYQPEACLSSASTVYGGLQDKEVPARALHGWKEHTSGLKIRLIAGNHFFIQDPNVHFPELLWADVSVTLRALRLDRKLHPDAVPDGGVEIPRAAPDNAAISRTTGLRSKQGKPCW